MSDLAKDPFEEFEFKPINEGLGFHRKPKSTLTQPTANFDSGISIQPTRRNLDVTGTPLSAPTPSSSFQTPLPRQTYGPIGNNVTPSKSTLNIPSIEDDSIAKAQSAVNEILKNLNQKRQMDFAAETEKMQQQLKKSRPLLFAASLDGMLILAAFLMSMIAMLTITKVDLFLNLTHPETSGFIYFATALLFIGVAFIYMVINRAFLGYTPGEWAFDQRCGNEADMQTLSYIPRVALRSILVIGTGFIIMQILSNLFNKDIAGQLSGVNIFRSPNAQ